MDPALKTNQISSRISIRVVIHMEMCSRTRTNVLMTRLFRYLENTFLKGSNCVNMPVLPRKSRGLLQSVRASSVTRPKRGSGLCTARASAARTHAWSQFPRARASAQRAPCPSGHRTSASRLRTWRHRKVSARVWALDHPCPLPALRESVAADQGQMKMPFSGWSM